MDVFMYKLCIVYKELSLVPEVNAVYKRSFLCTNDFHCVQKFGAVYKRPWLYVRNH